MASIFDTLAGTFIAVLGDDDLWTYTTRGGATAQVKGIFEEPARVVDVGAGPQDLQRFPELSCAEADLPGGRGKGDSVQRGTVSYVVQALLPDGHGMVRLILETA
jgi:hypothetical protein